MGRPQKNGVIRIQPFAFTAKERRFLLKKGTTAGKADYLTLMVVANWNRFAKSFARS